ncbi:MAG: SUMF1/EgtB/PvdO family nonheme iron enzyme [Pseudomonadota bacterium]
MPATSTPPLQAIDSPDMRRAGGELLSLALLDARNHTLDLLGQLGEATAVLPDDEATRAYLSPALWTAGHAGWFQERWTGRNPQRSLGSACAADALRLGSIEALADSWWDPAQSLPQARWQMPLPDAERVRAYLLDVLEGTLGLLEKTPDTDDALYFYRLALFHEDRLGETLVRLAQALGLPLQLELPQASVARAPLLLPATRWTMGVASTPLQRGFAFDEEQPAHTVDVPDCEIDAQPVSWAQFIEFVDDDGYDRQELWHPEGWAWLQQLGQGEGRRAPRHVTQISVASGAVLQTRFGKAVRLAGHYAAVHLSWWEADAWCRWAGRRLPTEVEWEMAALTAAQRGFRWGDVWEWTAATLRPYPGYLPGPAHELASPWFGRAKVLRGASFATRARMRHARFRGFALPDDDTHFAGFRSCAI